MFRKIWMFLGLCFISLAAFCDSNNNSPIEKIGILKYPVYTVGGETTGMAMSVPRHKDYELEISDPALFALAQSLNKILVRVKGELYTKPGIEVPPREIIKVDSLSVPEKKLQCQGSEHSAGIYEGGSIAIVQKQELLLGVMNCRTERDILSCREQDIVDAGYRLESIHDKIYRLFEISFFGERQIDILLCD